MTKEEFQIAFMSDLTPTEIALINFNIYFNPDHIEYYTNYHMGEYKWCYDYLIKNRNLLDIKHTPKERVDIAKKMIEANINASPPDLGDTAL